MEYQNIIKLLGNPPKTLPKFNTKKWVEVYDQSGGRYSRSKQIILCDHSDAYIVVKGRVTVVAPNNDNYDKILHDTTLKNNPAFISCISKIDNTLIGNADDLDVVMSMYNLTEYNKNYRETTAYRDESNTFTDANDINYSIRSSKSCDYETSITGILESTNTTKDDEIIVPLKYLSFRFEYAID